MYFIFRKRDILQIVEIKKLKCIKIQLHNISHKTQKLMAKMVENYKFSLPLFANRESNEKC